jgi:polysaccharide biosynthesis transport protein
MPEPTSQQLVKKDDSVLKPDVAVARIRRPKPVLHDQAAAGITKADIFLALFRHKGKIILGTIVGLAVAGGVYFFYPPVYESQAKLLVRYLVERSGVDPDVASSAAIARTAQESILGSEAEILSSWDLAVQVAEAIGPKRLLPNSKSSLAKEAAASTVASGLQVKVTPGSNIIFVSYKNGNPELTTLVLSELVNRYFNKHLEVHRSIGAFDFVTQQTDQVRSRLSQTEDALRGINEKAGILSLGDGITALSNEAVREEQELHSTQADIAEEQARIGQIDGSLPSITIVPGSDEPSPVRSDETDTASAKTEQKASINQAEEVPENVLQQYQLLVSRMPHLRQNQLDLLSKYTLENQLVKSNQAEIDEAEKERRRLEKKYPSLPARVAPIASSNQRIDLATEAARLAGLRARRNALSARLREVRQQIQKLSALGPQVADLERQRQLEEANYKYFEATLEKARVDEALDPSKIPNISTVQRPSPPMLVTKQRDKIAVAAAVGGFMIAAAFALLKELVFTTRVRRPSEIENIIGLSPLMSIPYSPGSYVASPAGGNGKAIVRGSGSGKNVAPWDIGHFIRPYTEAIRDRLGLYFELHNLTHKPKLVGVSGFSNGAGTSTLAAGLAAALSETNDGKVLLVDVNLGPHQVHPFFRGKPAYPLNTALDTETCIDPASENLYLATVGSPNTGPAQLGLKKFFDLMPNLKASDFDYIIFDMPPLAQTSPTWGIAPFMDKLLIVVEAEKDSREVLRRSYRKLLGERDNVSVVLNKTRYYAPKSFDLED